MHQLDKLFKPKSVAVIGASDTPGRAGFTVTRNLQSGGFQGPIMPVTPKYEAVAGILAYPSIDKLPRIPDLAILCTHGRRSVQLLTELGKFGVPAVIILAAGTKQTKDSEGRAIFDKMQAIAREYGIRILGPNSLGLILPWLNLNASFAPVAANRGKIAFVSQSSSVCSTILDWARDKKIGFSSFVCIGETGDIDFPETLDYLSQDSKTESILLYVDHIRDARSFLSAARAAARNRRILVVKAGRTEPGSKALSTFTQMESGLDATYDAAIRRAGMLRVKNTHELFAAVETLAHSVPLRGERLAIVSNGGGPALMAVDALADRGGKLATFSEETYTKLDAVLPVYWSNTNPIDLGGDATTERYLKVLDIILDSDEADAILLMHSPSVTAPGLQTSKAIIERLKENPRARRFNILTNWGGEGDEAVVARLAFTHAGYPTYRTPESAVSAYMHLVEYRRNQRQLMETPVSVGQIEYNAAQTRALIEEAISLGSCQLNTHEAQHLLEEFGFNVLPTWLASDATEAVSIAEQVGYPVAIKLRSPDILHKSEVQGVMLNLRNPKEVSIASQAILDRVGLSFPDARVDGLLVQSMANRAGALELRVTVRNDPVFGPVILLGEDGTEWNVSRDAAVALPPLNMALARYLVIGALKEGKLKLRGMPDALDVPSLSHFLVTLSQVVIDCPEINELDIHPLLVSGDQLTIVDASLTLNAYTGDINQRLAIRPYPKELEEAATLRDGREILLRPILPEDEPNHKSFIENVSVDDLYKRFFSDIGEVNHEMMAKFTQIDYDREMAFVAVSRAGAQEQILGVVRALADPQIIDAEFAVLVRSDLKGVGLGSILMDKIIRYAKTTPLERLSGITMPSNRGMIALAQKVGFSIDVQMEDGIVEMLLPL